MIVVLIIGILLAIAIPNFVSARESSRAKACVGNLKQIDSAKQQYCMDKKLRRRQLSRRRHDRQHRDGLQLVGTSGYIRATPVCPSAGTYHRARSLSHPHCSMQRLRGTAPRPTAGHQLRPGGKFYHGLSN